MDPIKLRLTYSKTGLIRFISHRDLIRVFFRAFSRAGLPIAYSEGFSPHPRVSFCPPLKVGMEGLNELLEATISRPVEADAVRLSLNDHLPEGIRVKEASLLPPGALPLGRAVAQAEYRVFLKAPVQVTGEMIRSFLLAGDLRADCDRGGETEAANARRGVEELELDGEGGLRMLLFLAENGRPYAVLAALSGAAGEQLPALRWQRLRFLDPGVG
ncbi:MAG: TIGR03936 family radical SAM-associated protein [PVC group bacterium]